MRNVNFVALDSLGEFSITGVQVQSMSARNKRVSDLQVAAQFSRRAGAARIVSSDGKSTAKFRAGPFVTPDIVTLPAMQRYRNRVQSFNGGVRIDAKLSIVFACDGVSAFDSIHNIRHL